MKNLKDKITNYCAIVIAISGALLTPEITNVIHYPVWITSTLAISAVMATSLIGYFTGKSNTIK
jgi:hypothetical protein